MVQHEDATEGPRGPNVRLVRLSDGTRLDNYSARPSDRSNGSSMVEEGDRCVIPDVKGNDAVAIAYEWADLDLGHDFHGTAQGCRFTINEAARHEGLKRLLGLNQERYTEEVARGLHDKKASRSNERRSTKRQAVGESPKLIDMEND